MRILSFSFSALLRLYSLLCMHCAVEIPFVIKMIFCTGYLTRPPISPLCQSSLGPGVFSVLKYEGNIEYGHHSTVRANKVG